MATYKLIQDIEAEDHILGPLTLRQFIFGLLGAFCWYLCFIIFVKQAYLLLTLFAPPALFCTFFAIPFGRDQPTEVWALAILRFWFKPRRRIWDQSGVKELVTITVPKKIERVLTNGLSQNEVESRLKALANTLDSRGWAIKNATAAQPNPLLATDSDRLIDITNAPGEVPNYEVRASDDILDEITNPVAKQFDTMINQSSKQHRQQLIDELNHIRMGQPVPAQPAASPSNYWFMSQPAASSPPPASPVTAQAAAPAAPQADITSQPDVSAYEATLSTQLKAQNNSQDLPSSNLRTLQPTGSQPAAASAAAQPTPAVTATPDPAILSLANNDDLNVSTLAREAYKAKHGEEPPQDEVVISLR